MNPLAVVNAAREDYSSHPAASSEHAFGNAMVSFVVNLLVRTAYRRAVPASITAVKRFPVLAVLIAAIGQSLGAWLIWECTAASD